MNTRMKLAIATLLVLLAVSHASAQTYDPYLPDTALINYSGDASYYQVWINWTARTSTGIIATDAQCAGQGIQGNPGSYTGYWIGAGLGYHTTLPQACGPLVVSIVAGENSWNQYGYPDHLWQGLSVRAQGSLPGGRNGVDTQTEACSLVGDDYAVGGAHTVVYDPGLCIYYGGQAPM